MELTKEQKADVVSALTKESNFWYHHSRRTGNKTAYDLSGRFLDLAEMISDAKEVTVA